MSEEKRAGTPVLEAFAEEAASHWRYLRCAFQAEAEGLVAAARAFREAARVELESAERLLGLLSETEVGAGIDALAGVAEQVHPEKTTLESLRAAIEREQFDGIERYPSLAEAARREARVEMAGVFDDLAKVDRGQADRLRGVMDTLGQKAFAGPAAGAEPDVLAQASVLAARHRGLAAQASAIEGLMRLVATTAERVESAAGAPRKLVDFDALAGRVERSIARQGALRQRVWDEPMLRAADLAKALGARSREFVRTLRDRSELLALPHKNSFLYPAFQVDVDRRCLYEEAAATNRVLRAKDKPWAAATWWVSQNGWLEARPCDLLGTDRAHEVLEAAKTIGEHLRDAKASPEAR